jgi:hypothetical protein
VNPEYGRFLSRIRHWVAMQRLSIAFLVVQSRVGRVIFAMLEGTVARG